MEMVEIREAPAGGMREENPAVLPGHEVSVRASRLIEQNVAVHLVTGDHPVDLAWRMFGQLF